MLEQIPIILFILVFFLTFSFCFIDYRKKRELKKRPNVSFLIPCYNDGESVGKTVKSIYGCYDLDKIEVIVANDCSKDNSLEILKKLSKTYPIRIINNKHNLGKAKTLNENMPLAKNEIVIVVDADVIVNKKALEDMLARIQKENVGAVSCPYQPINKGFLARMQHIEYNLMMFIQGSYNIFSALSLWGGFLGVKKKAFKEVKGFSENAILEDMDLALKLTGKGWRVEQSFYPIQTYVPDTLKSLYKQKLRWTSGGMQCMINHYPLFLRHPIHLLFMISLSLVMITTVFSLVVSLFYLNNLFNFFILITQTSGFLFSLELVGFSYSYKLLNGALVRSFYVLFTIPYVVSLIHKKKDIWKMCLIFPFCFVYYPAIFIVNAIGSTIGILRYRRLERGERAW